MLVRYIELLGKDWPAVWDDVLKLKANFFLSWMATMWNNVISPVVREAVIRNSGKEASDIGQQKVVSTALYVLMQRAMVPGCPLSGQGGFVYVDLEC